jgi:hypothetical protein
MFLEDLQKLHFNGTSLSRLGFQVCTLFFVFRRQQGCNGPVPGGLVDAPLGGRFCKGKSTLIHSDDFVSFGQPGSTLLGIAFSNPAAR